MNEQSDSKLHLNRDHALHLLREMLRIRRFEERCAELYTEEKIRGFLHEQGIAVKNFRRQEMNLEDAFIGLTGKY